MYADSLYPWSHKAVAYNSFVHRLPTIPMSQADYNEVVLTLKYIAAENGYKTNLIDQMIKKNKKKNLHNILNDIMLTREIKGKCKLCIHNVI